MCPVKVIIVDPPEQIGLVVAVAAPPILVGSTVTVASDDVEKLQTPLVTIALYLVVFVNIGVLYVALVSDGISTKIPVAFVCH